MDRSCSELDRSRSDGGKLLALGKSLLALGIETLEEFGGGFYETAEVGYILIESLEETREADEPATRQNDVMQGALLGVEPVSEDE